MLRYLAIILRYLKYVPDLYLLLFPLQKNTLVYILMHFMTLLNSSQTRCYSTFYVATQEQLLIQLLCPRDIHRNHVATREDLYHVGKNPGFVFNDSH